MTDATRQLAEVDVFSDEFLERPGDVYDATLAEAPVATCPFGMMALGHDAVRDLMRDDARFVQPNAAMFTMFGIEGGPFKEWFTNHIQALDGERHARIRKLVARAFSARAAELNRPMMAALVDELLQPLVDAGTFDFVHGFSSAFPIRVFCRMIGVPEADVPRFAHWAETLGQGFDMNLPEVIDDLDEAAASLRSYVEELLEARARVGDEGDEGDEGDLVGTLLAASADGERLTRTELVDLVSLLLGAGYDTTANQLAWGVRVLAERPDVLERLQREPGDVPRFVDELLRVNPAVGVTGRVAAEDATIGDTPVPAGTYVMVSIQGAGRDPRSYDDPATFDMDRASSETLLSFGWGEHYCLGVHLARAELQEFFETFTRHAASVELAGDVELGNPLGVYAVKSLPVRVTRRRDGT